MSYADFVIAKEHKFLRNIFSEDELSTSEAIKNIHFENFSKILKNCRLFTKHFKFNSGVFRL